MGLYLREKLDNGAVISVWKITESEEELMNSVSVPNDELEELSFIRTSDRRKEKLAIRALLDCTFDEKVYLGHHDNGRPFIQNNVIEISISHCNDYAAIMTHPVDHIGIDIESTLRDFSVVEKRILSEEEREDLSSRDTNTQLAVYWSAKEAVYKLMSRTSVDFESQIKIEKFTLRDEGELEAFFIDRDGGKTRLELGYRLFDNHVLVWACEE